MSAHSPIQILLVEDNPGDVRLTREVLKDGRINDQFVTVVRSIEEFWLSIVKLPGGEA